MTTVDEARALRDAEGLRMKIFEPHLNDTDMVVVTTGDTGGYPGLVSQRKRPRGMSRTKVSQKQQARTVVSLP